MFQLTLRTVTHKGRDKLWWQKQQAFILFDNIIKWHESNMLEKINFLHNNWSDKIISQHNSKYRMSSGEMLANYFGGKVVEGQFSKNPILGGQLMKESMLKPKYWKHQPTHDRTWSSLVFPYILVCSTGHQTWSETCLLQNWALC